MTTTWAAVFLLLAVPGLITRRGGNVWVRLATVCALGLVGLGALDLQHSEQLSRPRQVAVVPTRAAADFLPPPGLRRALGEEAQIESYRQVGGLVERALAARLHRQRSDDLVLVWNGPWSRVRVAGDRDIEPPLAGARACALVPGQKPPLDPELVRLRQTAPWAVGRPGELLIETGPVPDNLHWEVKVVAPDDGAVMRRTVKDARRKTPGAPATVEFEPQQAGTHLVELRLAADGYEFVGKGRLQVGRAMSVQVVGFEAPQLARALAVQGLGVTAEQRLPDKLADVVVLLDQVPPAEQQRLTKFVEDGGGLLVIGGSTGGALPAPTEPLHEILPVRRLPQEPHDPGDRGTGEGTGNSDKPQPGKPEKPEPKKPEKPEPKKPEPKKPEKPDKKPNKTPKKPPAGDMPDVGRPKKPKIKKVERRTISMVFLIDRSQSMSTGVKDGFTRMDYAKRAAVEAARMLHSGDRVGVVSFGNRGHGKVVLPLTSVKERAKIRRTLSGLSHAWEGTFLEDALNKATRLLAADSAPVKHVVVVTDGEIMDTGVQGRFAALKAAARARKAGCTVSVIQVVPQTSGGMNMVLSVDAKKLADNGGGAFVRAKGADVIPQLVSTEVRRTMARAGREPSEHGDLPPELDRQAADKPEKQPEKKPEEQPEKKPEKPPEKKPEEKPEKKPEPAKDQPKAPKPLKVRAVMESPLVRPVPQGGYPDLYGILPVRGRTDAQVLLVAGTDGVPLLAFANRGLGKVSVWTADLLGEWGQDWRKANAFPGLLAQWVQSLMPALTAAGSEAVVENPQPSAPLPLPRELAELRRWTEGRVSRASGYRAPPPAFQMVTRGLAADHALWGVVGLLSLLLVEFLVVRRLFRRVR